MIKLQDIKLEEGDIVFFNTKSLLSKAINIVQRGGLEHMNDTPSHVATVTAIYANIIVITEAVLSGVRVRELKITDKTVVGVKRIIDPLHMHEGLVWLSEQVGRGYDYGALVGILLRSFWRLFGKKVYQRSKRIKNFLDSKVRFVCSEMKYIFIQKVTEKKPWDSVASQTTVWDLYRSKLLKEVSCDIF